MSNHREQNAVVREEFGRQAAGYARLMRDGANPQLARLIDAVQPTRDDRVLDVGCGPGRLSLSLAEITGHVTGIDLTPQMLEQAKAFQAERGIANVEWLQGDILPMPFADRTFSLVITQATFHHLADPRAVLAEMIRVCTRHGRIVVVDLSPEPAKAAAFDDIEKLRDPSHVHAWPAAELRNFGSAAGLAELAFHRYGTDMPIEAVLASSSLTDTNVLETLRRLYREDAASGEDRYGMNVRESNGEILATYPMTMAAWRRVEAGPINSQPR